MFDPSMYPDDVVLSTREVAAWTSWRRRTVLSLPGLSSLDHIPKREAHFRAGDVKAAILGDPRRGVHREISDGLPKPPSRAAKTSPRPRRVSQGSNAPRTHRRAN